MDRETYLIKQIAHLKEVYLNAMYLREQYEKELKEIQENDKI